MKEQLKEEVLRFRELSGIKVINESTLFDLISDFKKLFSIASDEMKQKSIYQKLVDFFEKNLSTITDDASSSTLTTVLPSEQVVDIIIKTIEGGYYDPAKHYQSAMLDSGETMFGMDRKHGSGFTNSPAGQKFWGLIDVDKEKNKNNPKKWYHYYTLEDNPTLKQELQDIIAGSFLEPYYQSLSNKYLDPETRDIVNSDGKLKIHMQYAVWNGSGWFKEFAEKLNNAVKSGITDVGKLIEVALDSRLSSSNSHMRKSGKKLRDDVFPQVG